MNPFNGLRDQPFASHQGLNGPAPRRKVRHCQVLLDNVCPRCYETITPEVLRRIRHAMWLRGPLGGILH
jgi:hypothetical protein